MENSYKVEVFFLLLPRNICIENKMKNVEMGYSAFS